VNKKIFNALERVFEAEIENRLPFQSNAKIYQQLERHGLLTFGKEVRPTQFGDLVIKGYWLTHAGRIMYCQECDKEVEVAWHG